MADTGRPTVMTKPTIRKLEDGFLMGFSDREACLYADIAPSTLYAYCEANPGFSERKELLKEQPKMLAKRNVVVSIREGKDDASKWYLERRDPDFKAKSEQDSKGHITVEMVNFGDGAQTQTEQAEA